MCAIGPSQPPAVPHLWAWQACQVWKNVKWPRVYVISPEPLTVAIQGLCHVPIELLEHLDVIYWGRCRDPTQDQLFFPLQLMLFFSLLLLPPDSEAERVVLAGVAYTVSLWGRSSRWCKLSSVQLYPLQNPVGQSLAGIWITSGKHMTGGGEIPGERYTMSPKSPPPTAPPPRVPVLSSWSIRVPATSQHWSITWGTGLESQYSSFCYVAVQGWGVWMSSLIDT